MAEQPWVSTRPAFTGHTLEEHKVELDVYITNLFLLLQSLEFSTNIRGRMLSGTFNATPGIDLSLVHNLGTVPTGYLVVSLSDLATIYNGAAAWTTSTLSLRSSTGSVVVTVFVF